MDLHSSEFLVLEIFAHVERRSVAPFLCEKDTQPKTRFVADALGSAFVVSAPGLSGFGGWCVHLVVWPAVDVLCARGNPNMRRARVTFFF